MLRVAGTGTGVGGRRPPAPNRRAAPPRAPPRPPRHRAQHRRRRRRRGGGGGVFVLGFSSGGGGDGPRSQPRASVPPKVALEPAVAETLEAPAGGPGQRLRRGPGQRLEAARRGGLAPLTRSGANPRAQKRWEPTRAAGEGRGPRSVDVGEGRNGGRPGEPGAPRAARPRPRSRPWPLRPGGSESRLRALLTPTFRRLVYLLEDRADDVPDPRVRPRRPQEPRSRPAPPSPHDRPGYVLSPSRIKKPDTTCVYTRPSIVLGSDPPSLRARTRSTTGARSRTDVSLPGLKPQHVLPLNKGVVNGTWFGTSLSLPLERAIKTKGVLGKQKQQVLHHLIDGKLLGRSYK